MAILNIVFINLILHHTYIDGIVSTDEKIFKCMLYKKEVGEEKRQSERAVAYGISLILLHVIYTLFRVFEASI